jgi:serine/threonine protein kinase
MTAEENNAQDSKPSDATVVLTAKEIAALGFARPPSSDKDEVTKAMLVEDMHAVLSRGTKLAEFEITGVIGQGGFGIVYEARDSSLERDVAIKEYLPSSLAQRTADGNVTARSSQHQESFEIGLKSFVNEARLLAQFDHPSLLKVYRFWDERGTTYMVMPLYKGQTLKQVLAKKEVTVDEAWLLNLLDGVTQALALIHASNCYHRDIAPDNIMLVGENHHPVVLDFGAARRVLSGMTQALTVILKPGYAPVEQYADSPDFKQGPWTDIYALGAVMYVAIAKKPPPPSVTRLLSDSYKRLSDDPDLSANYSERFLSAIDACLAVRPEDRPQSMGAFRALLGLGGGNPMSAMNSDASVMLSTPVTKISQPLNATLKQTDSLKRRTFPIVTTGVAAVLLLVVTYSWWSKSIISTKAPVVDASVPAVQAALPAVAPAAAITTPPAAAAASVIAPSLATLFDEISTGAAEAFKVTAVARNPIVKIANKEKLEFTVQSANEGYVYVYLLSSGGELLQLFPNQLDKRNRIKTNETFKLPRASWPMEAGGPQGTNKFVAIVSAVERDFTSSGLINDGVFGRFSMDKNQVGIPAIAGKPKCAAEPTCDASFGAARFSISEE